ncbi:hypothetical protein CDAR_494931 [Caerostris darwini]|uniref:Ycf15 n=1 Tax=Caerostris darwini TaxID=1538125 RepID=A0AAV4RV63_9ARAC|nr:hypothetical protein CDAR_494931 [Caerostris darwini]
MIVLLTGKNALFEDWMSLRGGGGPVSERNGVSGKYDQNIDYPNGSRHFPPFPSFFPRFIKGRAFRFTLALVRSGALGR